MKAFLTFLIAMVLAAGAFGAEPPDKKLAIEYLKISRFEQIMDASIQAYSNQLLSEVPTENRLFFEKMMREAMGWEATKDDLAKIVIRLYSKDELKAFIAFSKTPLGASFNAKSVRFSDEFSVLLANNLQKFIQECPLPAPTPAANPDAAQ